MKADKANARYIDVGSDKEHCAICNNYVAPGACSKVKGSISPAGWCKYFHKNPHRRKR